MPLADHDGASGWFAAAAAAAGHSGLEPSRVIATMVESHAG